MVSVTFKYTYVKKHSNFSLKIGFLGNIVIVPSCFSKSWNSAKNSENIRANSDDICKIFSEGSFHVDAREKSKTK